jgi:hypothetical protein
MSLSKEAKALRAALQAAGVSVDACAQTLMVAAAKYINERTPKFGDPFVKAEGTTIDRFSGEMLPCDAEISKPAKPKAKKSK